MLNPQFAALLDGIAAVAWPGFLLALTVSGLVVVSGLNRRRLVLQRQAGRRAAPEEFRLTEEPFTGGPLDVATEVFTALRELEGLAANRLVAVDVVVQPGLAVRADARAFRQILRNLLERAIEQTPCGQVLLAAGHIGGRVQISVADDSPRADKALRASQLRPAERLAALQAATMVIDARPGHGTTVLLRLPAAAGPPLSASETADIDPTQLWTATSHSPERSALAG